MVEANTYRRLLLWSIYCGLSAFIGFLFLLPLNFTGPHWAAPDLILGLTYVWSLRRPHDLPIILIAIVIFIFDLLLQRPPGLMAAIVVVGCEFMRSRAPFLRDAPFIVEWFVVGVVIAISFAANRFILTLVMVPRPALSTELLHTLVTVISFPIFVVLFRWAQNLGRAFSDRRKVSS